MNAYLHWDIVTTQFVHPEVRKENSKRLIFYHGLVLVLDSSIGKSISMES